MKKYFLPGIIFLMGHVLSAQTNAVLESIQFLNGQHSTPADYVVSKFSRHSIVLLAEEHALQNNLLFVKELIPGLYKAVSPILGWSSVLQRCRRKWIRS